MSRKFNSIFISVLAVSLFLIFTSPVYGQRIDEGDKEKKEQEEKPKLTREAQLAMVAAQRAIEKDKDYAAARKFITDYLASKPEVVPAEAYLMLGYYWYSDDTDKAKQKDHLKEAMKVFKEGSEKYPDNFDLLQYYAATLYELEDFAKAAPMMEKVYEASKKKEIRYLEAASGAYYQVKKFEDAKRVIRKMIGLTDKPKENWYNMLYSILIEQEKLDEAQKVIFEALDRFPLNTNYWQSLSVLRQEKNDFYGMTGAYEIKNYIKPPEKPSQWKETINLYRSVNVPLRVARTIEMEIKGKNATEDEYLKLADAYAKAMKTDEAIKVLDAAIAKKPSSSALLLKKAEIIYSARRNKDAIKACDDLIAVNPKEGDGKAYYMKGNAAWDLQDWDTMEKAFEKAQDFKTYRAFAKNALAYIQSLDEAKSALEKH